MISRIKRSGFAFAVQALYSVVKYTNGEWKFVKETSKLSQTIRGLNSGKTYKYAVKAKVNGKWTTIGTTSTATVKVK